MLDDSFKQADLFPVVFEIIKLVIYMLILLLFLVGFILTGIPLNFVMLLLRFMSLERPIVLPSRDLR